MTEQNIASDSSSAWSKLDISTFTGALILLALATIPLIIWPEQGADWVDKPKSIN